MDLAGMIEKYALKRGDFTLASGKKSTFYLDVKKAYTRPEIMRTIAKEAGKRVKGSFDRVAGVALGAVPLAAVMGLEMDVPFIMIRKEKKGHGTGKVIEGELAEGDSILLVEDVTTSGGSALWGIQALRDVGGRCDMVLTVVDRDEGAKELLAKHGIELVSLVDTHDLGL